MLASKLPYKKYEYWVLNTLILKLTIIKSSHITNFHAYMSMFNTILREFCYRKLVYKKLINFFTKLNKIILKAINYANELER